MRNSQTSLLRCLGVGSAVVFFGCGRYGAPLAPEQFAPGAVRNLVAVFEPTGQEHREQEPKSALGATEQGEDSVVGSATGQHTLRLSWDAPLVDAQGLELKELSGFRVLKLGVQEQDLLTGKDQLDENSFVQVAEISSSYTSDRDALRKAARDKGQIGRSVNVDEAKLHHDFSDGVLRTGWLYLYKVVPVNQGGVEGGAAQIIRVRRPNNAPVKASDIVILSANEAGVS